VPVSIAGMDVAPGEIIHMDENGACKFPADRMTEVLKNVEQLVKNEDAGRQRTLSCKTWEELYNQLTPKK
jgi:4-hydroxy-4-methyl-2-oxoglutarate aldolase